MARKAVAEVGATNRNEQKLLRKTKHPGNHPNQRLWVVRCMKTDCGAEYGLNGCDFHDRRCPRHEGSRPGLDVPDGR